MANVGYATVSVIPSLKGFNEKIRGGLAGVEAEGKAAGSKLGGALSSTFAKVVAGVGAATGAIGLGKTLIDAAVESQKVGKQTDAVLKSMGKQAGLTSKDVGNLATSISNKTGIDDEAIQSGENLLLTFGKVRNEVGKGNDIFTRATKLAVDMSTALGQDLSSSNIQLGKALNDPVKGITALSRVGVSFTAQQKDQVKALVDSGKTLDAQKLILGEVEKQFKGSAEAQATSGEKLKVVFGNLQEQLGGYLLPVVEKVAKFLADNLPGAMEWLSRTTETVSAVVKKYWPQIQEKVTKAVEGIRSVVVPIVQALQALWDNFGDNILDLMQRIWPRVQQIIGGAMKIIQGIIKTVTALIQGDWSGVWEGIKGIVSGVWEAIQGIVGGALEVLRSAIGVVLETIGSIFKSAWEGIKNTVTNAVTSAVQFITDHWRGILQILTGPFGLAVTFIVDHFNQIVDFIKGLPGRIASVAKGMWDGIGHAFESVINKIIDIWNGLDFTLPSVKVFGHKIGGETIGLPDLPHVKLAQGGIIKHRPGGIFANIGEGRYDEAVVPLRPGLDPLSSALADAPWREANVYIDGKKLIGYLREADRIAGGKLLGTSAA